MKTAIVHIGAPKTGSSAIQASLAAAQDELAGSGIGYFRGYRAQGQLLKALHDRPAIQGKIPMGEVFATPEQRRNAARGAWIRLARQVRASRATHTIISEEDLIHIPDPEKLARTLRAVFERIWIVAYVRDPVALFPSMIDQKARRGAAFSVLAKPGNIIRPMRHKLNAYSAVFGRDAMIVRHFHRENLVGGSPQMDFAHTLSEIVDREIRLDASSVMNAALPGSVTCALILENEARSVQGLVPTVDWMRERRALVAELRRCDWLQGLEKLRLIDTPLRAHVCASHNTDCIKINARYLARQVPLPENGPGVLLTPKAAWRALHAWMGRYENREVTDHVRALQAALHRPRLSDYREA